MPQTPPPLLGFNNNVRHHGRIFHIQTEDSGVKRPHIISHLFGDGGRILKSVRTDYSEHVGREDMAIVVRRMMKEQHKAMFVALRSGELDEIIEKAFGPLEKPAPPKPPSEAPAAAAEEVKPAAEAEFATRPASAEELAEKAEPMKTPLPKEWLITPPSAPLWESPSAPIHDPPSEPVHDIPPLVIPPTPVAEVPVPTQVPAPISTAPNTVPASPRTPLLHPGIEAPPVPARPVKKTPPPLPHRRGAPTPRPGSSPGVATRRPPSAPRLPTPLPPSHSIGAAVERMAAKVAGQALRDSVPPDESPLSQSGEELQRRRQPPPTPKTLESAGRYSISRPSTIFGETPPDSARSLFGDPLIGEKSLDEVILSYLAEDLENPPK